jgi:hypothetical protein
MTADRRTHSRNVYNLLQKKLKYNNLAVLEIYLGQHGYKEIIPLNTLRNIFRHAQIELLKS